MTHPSDSTIPVRRLVIAIVMVMVSTLPIFLSRASFLQLQAEMDLTATTLGFDAKVQKPWSA